MSRRGIASDADRAELRALANELGSLTKRLASLSLRIGLEPVQVGGYQLNRPATGPVSVTREELHSDPGRVLDMALQEPVSVVDNGRIVMTICRSMPPLGVGDE